MSGPPVPARGRGRGLITLGVVAALLFVASGLLGGLLFASNGDLTRTEKLLAAEEQRSTAAEDKVKTLEAQLRASNDRAGDLQETLQGAEGDRDEQERQKQVIATCLDRFTEALGATSQSEFEKLIKKAEKPCEEAEDYM
jgi:septal ring factor EnvC (AmiA/AmiB activator)